MYANGIAYIRRRNQSRIGQLFQRPFLRFDQQRTRQGVLVPAAIAVRSYLHGIKSHIRIAPAPAPCIDQLFLQCTVSIGKTDVGFALIPDESTCGISGNRGDHSVVQLGRMIFVAAIHRQYPGALLF